MREIQDLSRDFHVNAEWGKGGDFPHFLAHMRGKRVLVLSDPNTRPKGEKLLFSLGAVCAAVDELVFPESEPVADEKTVSLAIARAKGYDYLLAVGAGTLNDIAKYAGYCSKTPSGIFATAPSMDGFTSGVTPLIEKGAKVTKPAQVASDVLMDADVLASSPKIMRGAGVGDILAKDCCLTDWRISAHLTGESYNEAAAGLMQEALLRCKASVSAVAAGGKEGIRPLMDALLVSGYAMVLAGNSRPASGAEHHMSHFLEMDFLRRNERIPLHGVKVGLGTLISLYLYKNLQHMPRFSGCEYVYEEAEKLPTVAETENILSSLDCPVRFSSIGVGKETLRRMLFEAYRIRDRFTILTLYCTHGFMEKIADSVVERFF